MKDLELSEIDFNNMGAWPAPVKIAFIVVVCIAILVLGYFLDIQGQQEALARVESKEQQLKNEFKTTYTKVTNLDAYKRQMREMEESFGTMLRQLPSKTEVEDLIVDISQTGLSSGIEFKLFKPGKEKFVDFYAELPIKMSMTGNYHQFGAFVSGVAALPRIVTLHDITIKQDGKNDLLTMDMTAKTYRYLDDKEVAEHKKKNLGKKKRR